MCGQYLKNSRNTENIALITEQKDELMEMLEELHTPDEKKD